MEGHLPSILPFFHWVEVVLQDQSQYPYYFVLDETTGSHLQIVWHRIQLTLVDRWWIVRRAKVPVPCLVALQIAHQRWSIYGPLVVLLAFDGLGSLGSIKRCYSGFHNIWACVVNVCVVPYRTLSKNLGVLCQLALHSLVLGLFPQLWWRAVILSMLFLFKTSVVIILSLKRFVSISSMCLFITVASNVTKRVVVVYSSFVVFWLTLTNKKRK